MRMTFVFSSIKVKRGDDCCGSSLLKPLSLLIRPASFPSLWFVRTAIVLALKSGHLFSQKIKLLLQIYTNSLNLFKHQFGAIQKAVLFA